MFNRIKSNGLKIIIIITIIIIIIIINIIFIFNIISHRAEILVSLASAVREDINQMSNVSQLLSWVVNKIVPLLLPLLLRFLTVFSCNNNSDNNNNNNNNSFQWKLVRIFSSLAGMLKCTRKIKWKPVVITHFTSSVAWVNKGCIPQKSQTSLGSKMYCWIRQLFRKRLWWSLWTGRPTS